jgi:hypothetical protein
MLNISQAINNWYLKQLQSSHLFLFLNLESILSVLTTSILTISLIKKQRINFVLFKFVNHGS